MIRSHQRILFAIALLFLCIESAVIYAQETSPTDSDLFTETLELDIGTASYYELVAWCERLSLQTRGSRAELQNRLRAHYQITPPRPESEPTDSKQPIEIESANSSAYFEDPESGERYLQLHGDVVLHMRDDEAESIHTIRADRIVFNEEKNHLTASGMLEYTLEQSGKTEVFRGDSLSFSLDDWEGQFSQGTSTADRDLDEDTITFYYSGETIYRLADDIILLEQGTITSSNPDNPNYKIKASSISVLAPQEWALENAVLYVGHVPLMYFPFFFHPGDELFVHPAIGYLDIQGYYIQTTIYLIGEKKDSTGSLSFLRVTEESSGSYNTEIDGLFLRKQKKTKAESENQTGQEDQNELKLLADVYGRHGLFIGIDGTLKGTGFFRNFDILAGIARTRNIYQSETGQYTYLWQNETPAYASVWNSGFFLGLELPIRYGGSSSLKLSESWINLDLALAAYSDPFVSRDFFSRAEEIDWAGLLGIDEESADGNLAIGSRTDSFEWKLTGRVTPNVSALSPYLQTLQVSRLISSVSWRSKARPTDDFGDVTSFDPLGYLYPGRYYFYPDSMTIPSVAGRIAGTVFRESHGVQSVERAERQERNEDIPELRPPWESNEATDDAEEPPEVELRIPDAIQSKPVARRTTPAIYDHQLSYSVSPDFSLDSRFDSNSWVRPADIDLFGGSDPIEYSLANVRGNLQLTYRGNLFQSMLSINESVNVQGTFRSHFDPIDATTDSWQRLVDQDNTTSLFRASNALNLTAKPFTSFDPFSASSITYELGTTLFQRVYETGTGGAGGSYINEPAEWDDEFISTHKISATGKYDSPIGGQTLTVSTIMPPKDAVIDVNAAFQTWWFLTSLTFGFAERDTWESKQVSLTERITPDFTPLDGSYLESTVTYNPEEELFGDNTSRLTLRLLDGKFELGQTFKFDVEEAKAKESSTTLKVDWFTAQFTAREVTPLDFIPGVGWRASATDPAFLPYTARFSATYQVDKQRFWKNRIELTGSISSTWNLQFIKVTDSSLAFDSRLDLTISEFLKLGFATRSEQRASYLYIPALAAMVGGAKPVNPIIDILQSFNFFSENDRRESDFNLTSISLNAIHYLGDWELNFDYTGKPTLSTESDVPKYQWESTLSVFVRWYPIPEIKRNISYADGELGI